jgi:enediyne biosynthesis protein E4
VNYRRRLERKAGRLAAARAVVALLAAAAGCGRSASSRPAAAGFRDVTRAAGLAFTYDNDFSPAHRFVETTGGGCAFFDYDNDGLLDIFAIQGGPAPGSPARPRPRNALYHNEGSGRFVDVTDGAGLDVDTGYGQGVSVADFDNDGWLDLLVTSYGALHLFRNEAADSGSKATRGGRTAGSGRRFREVTREAGLLESGDPHWNTSAAWGDYDGDGFLDLAVCRYSSWFPDIERPCFDDVQRPIYCAPTQYSGDQSVLYRNVAASNGRATPRGNRRFVDVSRGSGFSVATGRALGALWLDYDADGRLDLFLAHDMSSNTLMRNLGAGKFANVAAQAGVAVGPVGQPLSGMGVAAGDFRGAGCEDLFIVNFSRQPRSYYINEGAGIFSWGSDRAGVGDSNQPFLAFGVEALDYDRDGALDLVVGNGHINEVLEEARDGVTYRQRQQLLRNRGDGRFEDDVASAGDLGVPRVTRGLATGDFDNDGRVDVLVSGPRSPLQLFRNETAPERHWIGLKLEGGLATRASKSSNREGIGAVARVDSAGRRQTRVVRSGSSYCSHSDTRVVFGLGGHGAAVPVQVRWPSGIVRDYRALQPDRYYLLREDGTFRALPETR